jgi:hypothetical protein
MGFVVADGPNLSADGHFDTAAYEKIEEVIAKSSVPKEIEVQPSLLAQVSSLVIFSDRYVDLTFKVDEDNTVRTLDGPLMMVGKGLIAMLGATLNKLTFTNANALADANITILVARDPVAPQGQ